MAASLDRWHRPNPGRRLLCARVALALLAGAVPLAAQEPPDSIRPDSLAAADSALAQSADSLAADTVYYNLPGLDGPAGAGWVEGSWTWELDDILATGATTLAELMAELPGMVPLLTGDYGTPLGLSAFGLGGGGLRVVRDGFEVGALEGGVPDLARVGLAGIGRVRLERMPTQLVVHLTSLEHESARPFSLVEAGTGDLNTNLFRGTFLNPSSFGGSIGLALERSDSRGARGDEPGNRTGSWLRYQIHRADRAGLAVDFRRMATETEAEPYATDVRRTDWTVRGRAVVTDGLVTEAYWGRSTHRVDDPREVYATEGGTRSQLGLRSAWTRDVVRLDGAYRRFGGGDLPSSRLDLGLRAERPDVGGLVASLERAAWAEASTSARAVRAWTRPLFGLSLFGSWHSGTYGARTGPLLDAEPPALEGDSIPEEPVDTMAAEPEPSMRVADRSGTRVGARFAWRSAAIAGALLRVEVDSLLPLGLEPDRGQPALGGGERRGWEVWGRLPTPLDGLHLEGSLQQWEEGWSYLPERIYRGALVYRNVFLESGNFEVRAAIGVRGRDPMSVRRVAEDQAEGGEGEEVVQVLEQVPFYQSWYGRVQLRIVTVRLFIGWDNFTIRRNLQDFPDRLLPVTRAVYGIQWTLWN